MAEELEIGTNVLYRWIKEALASELRRLHPKIPDLKLENDIFKKAAVIFAKSPQPKDDR